MKIKINIESKQHSLDIDTSETILHFKNKIISELFDESVRNKNTYIYLEFASDKPLRIFGKYTLYPGKLSSNYDKDPLQKFSLKENMIFNIIISEPPKTKRYIPKDLPKQFSQKMNEPKQFVFNNNDFPPLC